jgi:protein-arginine kinase activator protein McsA
MATLPRCLQSTCFACGQVIAFPEQSPISDVLLCHSCRSTQLSETIEQPVTLFDQKLDPTIGIAERTCPNCGVAFRRQAASSRILCEACDPDTQSLLDNIPSNWTAQQKKQYESYLANPMD